MPSHDRHISIPRDIRNDAVKRLSVGFQLGSHGNQFIQSGDLLPNTGAQPILVGSLREFANVSGMIACNDNVLETSGSL